MDIKALHEQQNLLQKEANQVLTKLRLPGRLSVVGRPIQVGSLALGLMVCRDLDITVICAELDLKKVAKICSDLMGLDGIHQLRFKNDTGHWNQDAATNPDVFCVSLTYLFDTDKEWNIDIRFIDEPERQPDLQHIKTIPPLLNPINREVILSIKQAWYQKPAYRNVVSGHVIYNAVLKHGISSLKEFDEWVKNKL